ncbi:MAG TPA: penicillin-binding protein 2, partial [Prolixibacteraceae bacterium]|nr:penicillin-binding protein 2 [Prolixibacteraceae bacterium]
PLAMREGIRESCNSYFWNLFRTIINHSATPAEGFQKWRDYVMSFGFGQKLGTELSSEVAGNIPQVAYYDKYFGQSRWNAMTVRSLAIGQGELLVTPLQLANMVATIANRGYYIAPHLVKAIQDTSRVFRELKFEKKNSGIDPEYYHLVIEGMQAVVEETKLNQSIHIDDVIICGKTGTVQNPHGADHSAFVGFAPRDNPKIAIAVFIQNAGFGATYAAPIAGLIMEKYLNDSIAPTRRELAQRLIETDLMNVIQVKK